MNSLIVILIVINGHLVDIVPVGQVTHEECRAALAVVWTHVQPIINQIGVPVDVHLECKTALLMEPSQGPSQGPTP